MIRIGDYSKLSRVSVKTLRYYDEMGLFKPAYVDDFTGYRYYSFAQLSRLYRILALKELGLSLEEIGCMLDDQLPIEQLRGMLRLRESQIKQNMQKESDQLLRVGAWLRQIDQEDEMSKYDVVIKKVTAFQVAAVRGVVPTPPDQMVLWQELEGYLAMQRISPVGPCLSLYHDDEYKEHDWDIEVCEPVSDLIAEDHTVKVYELPQIETMASVIHNGPFVSIGEAYDAVMRWMEQNNYRIIGPAREVYLQPSEHGSQTDPKTVTEIQFPVQKI